MYSSDGPLYNALCLAFFKEAWRLFRTCPLNSVQFSCAPSGFSERANASRVNVPRGKPVVQRILKVKVIRKEVETPRYGVGSPALNDKEPGAPGL